MLPKPITPNYRIHYRIGQEVTLKGGSDTIYLVVSIGPIDQVSRKWLVAYTICQKEDKSIILEEIPQERLLLVHERSKVSFKDLLRL